MSLSTLIDRPRPSRWQLFLREPCVYLARAIYRRREVIPSEPITSPVRVVCISDTHNSQPAIPNGDILIHAGDLTQSGTEKELEATLAWLKSLPHLHKIVVGGNHDSVLDFQFSQRYNEEALDPLQWEEVIYLENKSTTVTCSNGRKLNIYGSPLSAKHGNFAFQYPRTLDVWNDVPENLDVLITHGPPAGHLDCRGLGCRFLVKALWRTRPKLHVFGHVHEGYGREWIQFDALQEAYETTVIAKGGAWNLLRTFFHYVIGLFGRQKASSTLLVNAAQVGGLRDEVKRKPVVVDI